MAGPVRYQPQLGEAFLDTLLPLGMIMNFGYQAGVPSQPIQALGTGRAFGVRGKASYSWSCGRLVVQGRNFLRAIHTAAVRANIDVSKFEDPAATNQTSTFFMNLDSELFYIPFGLYVVISDKSRTVQAAMALEHCHITGYSLSISAGQAMIMDNVSGWCDRVLPLPVETIFRTEGAPTVETVRSDVLGMPAITAPDLTTK